MRGLKLGVRLLYKSLNMVAPHTGAWIEIVVEKSTSSSLLVAPHTGAWIEITGKIANINRCYVAPHTGAWIEIQLTNDKTFKTESRTPYGCVD